MSTEGLLYVATGDRYLAEAVVGAKSSRPHLGGRPIAIMTDDLDAAEATSAFDLCLPHPDPRGGYRDKIPGLIDLPFDRTLFLDSDARIIDSVDALFPLLEHHDLAAAQSPVRLPHGWRDDRVPPTFPELNTGVLLLRRGDAQTTVIERWLSSYDAIGQDWDQATFRSAVWNALADDLRLAILPPEANLRTTKPWIAGKGLPVTVVHGRIAPEEWPPLIEYLNGDVDRFRTSEEWRTRHPQSSVTTRVAPSRRDSTSPIDLEATFSTVDERWPDVVDDALPCENPIFILAAGWGSGPHLLQRTLTRDPNLMIWGAPHDRARIVQSLAGQWTPFTRSWPNERSQVPLAPEESLSDPWCENRSPAVAEMRQAHRLFLDRMFGAPARRVGRSRWGLEEASLDGDHLAYLRWLYPAARFILLVRHPFDAYAAAKPHDSGIPNGAATVRHDPRAFGEHWSRLSRQFHGLATDARCLLVRYEELQESMPALRTHVGVADDAPTDNPTAESSRAEPYGPASLGWFERRRLAAATATARRLLGY